LEAKGKKKGSKAAALHPKNFRAKKGKRAEGNSFGEPGFFLVGLPGGSERTKGVKYLKRDNSKFN